MLEYDHVRRFQLKDVLTMMKKLKTLPKIRAKRKMLNYSQKKLVPLLRLTLLQDF